MEINMKKLATIALFAAILSILAGCSPKTAVWNGKTEYYARVSMVINETDMYEYVGLVDYVFVVTVVNVVSNVIPNAPDISVDDLSTYGIRVDKNLKGRLAERIECSKHGGLTRDGTMLLYCSDNRCDTGLPEPGGQYIFMAYAQSDGSLVLSEFFDNRPYDQSLLEEYTDYCSNEIPFDRERFTSVFDISLITSQN